MKILYIFLFCCFAGASLGIASASIMGIPLAIYFGGIIGCGIGSLISLLPLCMNKNTEIFSILVVSFILSFPVAIVAGLTNRPFIAASLTLICSVSTFVLLAKRSGNNGLNMSSKAIFIVPILCIAVAGAYAVKFRMPNDTTSLIEMMGSDDMEISTNAAAKLRSFGRKEPFLGALKHKNPNVRAVAAHSLGLLDDKSVQQELVEVTKDSDPHVRMWATFSLGKIGSMEVLPVLSALERDEAEIVRIRAKEAIAEIKSRGTQRQ